MKKEYEKMNPVEFLAESLRLYEMRKMFKKARLLEKTSREGIYRSSGSVRTGEIHRYYTMNEVLDISAWDGDGTLEIHINPSVDETTGEVSFERQMKKGTKTIKDKDSNMQLTLDLAWSKLILYISFMGEHYWRQRRNHDWPDIFSMKYIDYLEKKNALADMIKESHAEG